MHNGVTCYYPQGQGVIPEFWSVIPYESIQLSGLRRYYPGLERPGEKYYPRLIDELHSLV
jgi:hypothetical protein